MALVARVLTALVALEHLWFLVLEMFLYTRPVGLRTFNVTPEYAQASAVLMQNQGLYNGFLAAGLLWGLLLGQAEHARSVKTFFLACVVVAGAFGGATFSIRIFFVQGIPALLALGALWASHRQAARAG